MFFLFLNSFKNKCGNFGFYPKVMCTTKSVWDRWFILECLDTKTIMRNLFYEHNLSWLLLIRKDLGLSTAHIWTRRLHLHKTTIFQLTWFSLVTVQLMVLNRQIEYRFEFSDPEYLEVTYLWSEDRTLIVGQRDR